VSAPKPHPRRDRDGARLKVGDVVRIVGVPDSSRMGADGRAVTKPVFEQLLGQYKRIAESDEWGEARLDFRISRGRHRGWHTVWIELYLLTERRGG